MVFSNGGTFNLDVSGIAGFFGGEESSAAMASVNLVRARSFVGWYNSPGSYAVAKKYGIIAGTRFWDGLFPGRDSTPAAILGLDGQRGPKFIGSQSATCIDMTGHLAYLLFSYCTDLKASPVNQTELSRSPLALDESPQPNGLHNAAPEINLTALSNDASGQARENPIAAPSTDLKPPVDQHPSNLEEQVNAGDIPLAALPPSMPAPDGTPQPNGLHDGVSEATQTILSNDARAQARDIVAPTRPSAATNTEYLYSLTLVPDLVADTANTNFEQSVIPMTDDLLRLPWHGWIAAFVTIGFSIAAAVVAGAKWHDGFGCAAIGIGILCNGFATLVYGSGTLSLHMPSTRPNSPAGDGIMVRDNDMVILRGPESKIASITRGNYKLIYRFEEPYNPIGVVSFALTCQAIAQLVLLPAATLNGQIIFLATFALSWCHNAYLASIDRERLQFEALRQKLGLAGADDKAFRKAPFQRWASMVAASAFYLKPTNTDDWLRQLIPNNTPVWDEWRRRIVEAVERHPTTETENQLSSFVLREGEPFDWEEINRTQLQEYLNDANIGYLWCRNK